MGKVIFKRKKGSQGIEKIISRPFEERHSEEDLHKFLESDPSLIAKGIGQGDPSPTIVIGSHLKLDNGELDLLLLDTEGELTVAELKRGRTPREVVAQLLDYASQIDDIGFDRMVDYGVNWDEAMESLRSLDEESENLDYDRLSVSFQNPRLLIVAFEIDLVTLRITKFLRANGIPVYCVEFEYFTDEKYEYYYPEVIGVDEVQRIIEAGETKSQQEYRKIWGELVEEFKRKKPGVTRRSGTKDNWMSLPIGISNAHFEWAIHGLNKADGWFEVGLHFEHHDKKRNLDALNWIKKEEELLKARLDKDLIIENWGKRWARVYLRKDCPEINQDVTDWVLEKTILFYDLIDEINFIAELRKQGW